MKVADGKLSYKETLPGYLDMIASKGKYKPGSGDAKTTFKLVAGKLWIEYEATSYDVDPERLERRAAKEKTRTFLSKEVEQKADR
jgi:hypothetical protein